MKRTQILFIISASIVLSVVSFSYFDTDLVNAQSNTSTDPKQLLRDFEEAKRKHSKQNSSNFEQLINAIETQLDFTL